jgi:hypothetical protein
MSIEASDVAAAILKALPECTAIVDAHLEEWPGEPMLYLLLQEVSRMIFDPPESAEQLDVIRRAYDLCERALSEGSREVRDCFAIELLEPLSGDPEGFFLAALGPIGRLMRDEMHEWDRLYALMKQALDGENEMLGLEVFSGSGIDAKNSTARVIVRIENWTLLSAAQHDESFARLRDAWRAASGAPTGITINGPRESNFRVLRD